MRGERIKGRVELFQKFISFCEGRLPLHVLTTLEGLFPISNLFCANDCLILRLFISERYHRLHFLNVITVYRRFLLMNIGGAWVGIRAVYYVDLTTAPHATFEEKRRTILSCKSDKFSS